MKKQQAKPESGGARLKRTGKHAVLLGLNLEAKELIFAAARADGRPVTQFLVHHGMQAARKILEETAI